MKRNTVISICKGIAIILMVMAHADCPSVVSQFIYEFHMPLFFIAAGYFFSLRYLYDEATFVKKRLKGLYLPFVEWSVFFLCIHNWMFSLGVLNEQYGNWSGGVTHPYTWHQAEQRLWNIVTAMGGYDEFLCGAFWFFRGLLVASLLYLLIYKIGVWLWRKTSGKEPAGMALSLWIPMGVCVAALALAGWKSAENLKVITLVQGGYRDIMGCFFFGMGFLFHEWEHRYKPSVWNTVAFIAVVAYCSVYFTANMNWRSTFEQFLWLPIPAVCGFLMTYNISTFIDRHDGWLRRSLVYIGNHTLPIFVLHIVSFKTVSILKILYYDLDWAQIGCHMVVHEHAADDAFFLLYTVAGVGIPLLLSHIWKQACTAVRKRVTR
ncbi:MAG: acyltransferase family protein [Prevotella sp.]|nr:acyltransferase family protein [Prevotella sp.]